MLFFFLNSEIFISIWLISEIFFFSKEKELKKGRYCVRSYRLIPSHRLVKILIFKLKNNHFHKRNSENGYF